MIPYFPSPPARINQKLELPIERLNREMSKKGQRLFAKIGPTNRSV